MNPGKYFEIFPDKLDNLSVLGADNDGSGQSQEGPEESDETVGEEPGQQETVLMFVSQLQVLSPGGGKGQEGRIFLEPRQTQHVEESEA